MKNSVLKIIVSIIVIASSVGVFFVMSIRDLVNKKDVCEVNIDAAGQLLIIENSINGIIPTGKDYYYIGLESSTGNMYTIHAGKKWLDENFDSNGMKAGDVVAVKGLIKRAGNFKVENEIANSVYQIATEYEYNLPIDLAKVIEINYIQDAIIKLIAGVLMLAVGIFMLIFKKRDEKLPLWAKRVLLILLVLILGFALWAIL